MDRDLQQKWQRIEKLLLSARSDLPEQNNPSPEFSALLTEFAEFIYHNELGLALEAIAAAGELVEPGGRFWHSLQHAAEDMELHAQAKEFNFRFVQAAAIGLEKAQNKT